MATCKEKNICPMSGFGDREGEKRTRVRVTNRKKKKKRCSSPVDCFWPRLARFPPPSPIKWGELKRNRCLQHSAWLHAVVQWGHTHYLLVFPLPARCFTLSTSCTLSGGGTRAWRRRLTAAPCIVLGALPTRGERGSKTSFKISFYLW